MSAASAFIEMPAERGGTTPPNGQEHFDMLQVIHYGFVRRMRLPPRGPDRPPRAWPVHLLVLW